MSLGTEIRRSDRVRLRDGRGPAVLVPSDCQRQSEGEDQADDAEQGRLQDPERLAQRLGVLPQICAARDPGDGRGSDHGEDDERKFHAVQREEHAPVLTVSPVGHAGVRHADDRGLSGRSLRESHQSVKATSAMMPTRPPIKISQVQPVSRCVPGKNPAGA